MPVAEVEPGAGAPPDPLAMTAPTSKMKMKMKMKAHEAPAPSWIRGREPTVAAREGKCGGGKFLIASVIWSGPHTSQRGRRRVRFFAGAGVPLKFLQNGFLKSTTPCSQKRFLDPGSLFRAAR